MASECEHLYRLHLTDFVVLSELAIMCGFQRSSAFIALLLLLLSPALAMDRSKCNKDVSAALRNGSITPNDPIFFRQDGVPKSHPEDIWLTIGGCEATCGKKFDWYTDIGPRLTIWLVPVIILIGNIQFAVLGKPTSLLTILHVLGDPVDSAWSLLTKLEASNRCWDLASKLSSSG